MEPKRTTRSTKVPLVTPAPTATTTTVTKAQLQALIDQGVAAAMAEAEASRVRNGYDSNGSGPKLAQAVRECTYPDIMKCQPLNFKGTEGVIGVTQWFEKIESTVTLEVAQALPWKTLKKMMTNKYCPRGFNISNCTSAYQVKYAAFTLQGVALTWWNSYVKTVTLEVAQALPWKTLKKMMTNKYCPRGEIKKLKTKMWELKTKVEKYIGGVSDMIHDSVKATKPKTMQEAIEFATELMDKRIRDAIENKQKFEGRKRQCSSKVYVVGNAGANPDNVVMDHHYNVEIAHGRIIGLNTIMRDFTLNFLNHPFNIDLLPVELGSFDVIVGMDWLSK
nr:hypothetical protein [Tanacetum cinerariifolium]